MSKVDKEAAEAKAKAKEEAELVELENSGRSFDTMNDDSLVAFFPGPEVDPDVSSIEVAAPPGGGTLRKPKDWEPPYIHVNVHDVKFTYIKMEIDNGAKPVKVDPNADPNVLVPNPIVVHVGFANEVDAKKFYDSFHEHIKKATL